MRTMKKYINSEKPDDYLFHVLIFAFVALINIVMLLLGERIEPLGYRSWAFYLTGVLFFLFHEADPLAKLIKLACGAGTGCLLAYGVIVLYVGPLAGLGILGLIIPIVISLMLLFLLGPFVPLCFNTVAFAYFTVSFTNAEEAVTNLLPNIISAVLGVLILDGGYTLISRWYARYKARMHSGRPESST